MPLAPTAARRSALPAGTVSADSGGAAVSLSTDPFVVVAPDATGGVSGLRDPGTWGIGRFEEDDGAAGDVCIAYFRSPADEGPKRVWVPAAAVQRATLPTQTRAYRREGAGWRVGRVLTRVPGRVGESDYRVQFPNGDVRAVPAAELFVRWDRPIEEPTDLLAARLNETPFFHTARADLVRCLAQQRRAFGGMPAAFCSAIDLVQHQLAVAHRVLHDPFQRYLLADEVGLGKTIEAGILLRQFLSEDPAGRALVLVPEALEGQWRGELAGKFQLGRDLDHRLIVAAYEDTETLLAFRRTCEGPGTSEAGGVMVIVDEAHHVAAAAGVDQAGAGGTAGKHPLADTYATLARLVQRSDRRVLLLSATPVLHNEASFLAMLHLLDPTLYPLSGLEAFRNRVRHRQAVGEALLTLREDEQNFFLPDALDSLSRFSGDDARFADLAGRLRVLLEEDVDGDDPERNRLIRDLRRHVGEVWRLHRRLLRNRRSARTECYLPGRAGATPRHWRSETAAALADRLAQWRVLHADCVGDSDPAGGSGAAAATRRLVQRFEEAAACDPAVLADRAAARHNGEYGGVPPVEGERDVLEAILHLAGRPQPERLKTTGRVVEELRRDGRSVIVFADDPSTADRVCEHLRADLRVTDAAHAPQFAHLPPHLRPGPAFGTTGASAAVASALDPAEVIRRHEPGAVGRASRPPSPGQVLVCDRRGEEGLNLQVRRAAVVHYDLPFAPGRVEQRMGRVDRFGSGGKVVSVVLVGEDSPTEIAWFRLLDGAFGVFDRSVAALQYLTDESMRDIWAAFPAAGAEVFDDAVARLGGEEGEIAKERRRVAAQDELDACGGSSLTHEQVDRMGLADHGAARRMRDAMGAWLSDRLNLDEDGEGGPDDSVRRYAIRPPRGGDGYSRTLVPVSEASDWFGGSDRSAPLAFDRGTAKSRGRRLARVGDPLVEAVAGHLRRDDRGVCFALWRYRPGPPPPGVPPLPDFLPSRPGEAAAVYFRFDFIVEARRAGLDELAADHPEIAGPALRRRADAAFPPLARTVWLDADLDPVPGGPLRDLLEQPYRDNRDARGGRDFNLNPQRWADAEDYCDATLNWRGLCFEARSRAEAVLRERTDLSGVIADCTARAAEHAEQRLAQYDTHLSLSNASGGQPEPSGAGRLAQERDVEVRFADALAAGLRDPDVRADAAGAVFLSAFNPFDRSGATASGGGGGW